MWNFLSSNQRKCNFLQWKFSDLEPRKLCTVNNQRWLDHWNVLIQITVYCGKFWLLFLCEVYTRLLCSSIMIHKLHQETCCQISKIYFRWKIKVIWNILYILLKMVITFNVYYQIVKINVTTIFWMSFILNTWWNIGILLMVSLNLTKVYILGNLIKITQVSVECDDYWVCTLMN